MAANVVEENFIDTDVSNSTDSCEKGSLYKPTRYRWWYRNLLFVGILNLMINLYQLNELYFNDDNLFVGSSLVASSDEVNRLTLLMEEEMDVTISEEYVDEYLVLNAVRENRHLNDEERDFFYRYIDMIKDNPYLDKETAYGSLLNFDILRIDRPDYIDDSVYADYVFSKRDIRLFTDDLEMMSLAHEGIHCIFINEKTAMLPDFFCEGMTELLTNEYFSDNPYVELESYPYEVCAVKMLCELTSTDTVLKAFSLGDMGYIVKEIGDIIGDYDEALLALNALECTFKAFNSESDEELNPKLGEYFIDVFNRCIEMKYLDDVDKRNDYLLQHELFVNIFDDTPYISYFRRIKSWEHDKPYFSSKLKNEYGKDKNTDICDNGFSDNTGCIKVYVKFD